MITIQGCCDWQNNLISKYLHILQYEFVRGNNLVEHKFAYLETEAIPEDKSDEDSVDKKAKHELNPNAVEFRPRVKRNSSSPVSTYEKP